MEVFLETTQ
jgi:hypothetical protein